MPDFILPAEADRCPHCGAVLYDPPRCCEAAMTDHHADIDRRLAEIEEQEHLAEQQRLDEWAGLSDVERERRINWAMENPEY